MVKWQGQNIYPVKLVGLSVRAQKIIKHYNNGLLMREYDDMGRPLCFAPNGKQAIYCMSPDFFWNGWFVLDEDVRFEKEEKQIHDIIKNIQENNDV